MKMAISTLLLPKRYERLQKAAENTQADLTQIVRKVPDATARIEQLIRHTQNSGIGRFELILGPSGSGKTTFLSTLPRFYNGIHVTPISETLSLTEAIGEIEKRCETPIESQVFVLIDRDNPELEEQDTRRFFERIRRFFRKSNGQVLILWPITDTRAAEHLARVAWEVGSDSIVDFSSKGIFNFTGLPKSEYHDVADITARTLNGGQGLEAFGLGKEVTDPILQTSETLSQYFGALDEVSRAQQCFRRHAKRKAYPQHLDSCWRR